VELAWYQRFAGRCDDGCRVPRLLASQRRGDGCWLVLEDLDAAGFSRRCRQPAASEQQTCLGWLAELHATFVGSAPDGLWRVGTYWHLATRPDELATMRDERLRDAAARLDARLSSARYRTLVHGDAKPDNFCFSPRGAEVRAAAVDFQYAGGGPGIRDVAYFLDAALGAEPSAAEADEALDGYFSALRAALARRAPDVDAAALEREWRSLYPAAWADFYRFLAGWAPHHPPSAYARRLLEQAIDEGSTAPR
jgi:aminoglycoside phosphotransferase (APT) family kinase protein